MFQIELDSGRVLEVLQRLQDSLGDMIPAMADIAQALASESERQFEDESGPDGGWPELSEVTQRQRERLGKWPGMMLQRSAGGLAASVQTGYDGRSAWIGSNKPYAAMHQFGGVTSPLSMIPNTEIPARPYMPFDAAGRLTDEAEATVLEVVRSYLADAAGG